MSWIVVFVGYTLFTYAVSLALSWSRFREVKTFLEKIRHVLSIHLKYGEDHKFRNVDIIVNKSPIKHLEKKYVISMQSRPQTAKESPEFLNAEIYT